MYQWPYNIGPEKPQWLANSNPCELHPKEGNCKAPYCDYWKDASTNYYTIEGDKLMKKRVVDALAVNPIGKCDL